MLIEQENLTLDILICILVFDQVQFERETEALLPWRYLITFHARSFLGSYHFLAHGGCGRNGMKDSVKFLIPPGSSRKIVDPPSLFEKILCDPPPSNHHHQKFVGFLMMSCRHAKVIALASWGSGGAVRSPGQSLRGGPGVGAHRSSENPGVSSSKNGL